MKDREKLKRLVQIIGDLLKVEGNEWLIDEILKTIGESSPVEEIAKHSLIQNIHEYCVEKKIDKQASDFYYFFPIQEIKDQLILDYKNMEHERRRDDFESFCLSLYQQIENITNFLFENRVAIAWDSNKNKIAYKFPDGKTLTQNDLIMRNSKEWYANGKFRAVLFYFYYNEDIKVIFPFNQRVSIFDELYQVRNQNHRGNSPTDFQKKIMLKIKGNESRYYFKFYGFLEDFTSKMEESLSDKILVTEKEITEDKNYKKPSNTLVDQPDL